MPKLLKNNEFYPEDTVVIDAETDINSIDATLLIPAKLWQEKKGLYNRADLKLGLLFESDDEPESMVDELDRFHLLAVNFPTFMDGRGYSISRILRNRCHYNGDIRAVGDIQIDQLFNLKRCGFSSFSLRDDQIEENALKALDTFTLRYQGSSDDPQPLYRKRA